MRYLLLVCWDAGQVDALTEPETGSPPAEEERSQVTSSRRRDARSRCAYGEKHVTDGPFATANEAVGGLDLIEAESLDEAVDIAAGHPIAQFGTVEGRPLWGN